MQTKFDPETWLVVGAGAMGLLWSCRLRQQGLPVHLLHRQRHPEDACIILEEQDSFSEFYVNQKSPPTLYHQYANVLFCTKAFDLLKAHQAIKPFIAATANLICLCNGMGAQQALATHITDQQTLLVGTTSEGALKISLNHVKQTGAGDTFIGRLDSDSDAVPSAFTRYRCANILEKMHMKLVVNAVINPITAIYRITNGEILSEPYIEEVKAACREISLLYCHEEFAFLQDQLSYQDILERVISVAQKTATNRSSMLEDVLNERPTEIDYIAGFLTSSANSLGVDMPMQTAYLSALRQT